MSQFDRGVASCWPEDKSGEDAVRVLGAEVERLRATVADLRLMLDGLETAAHEERADAVAHLRAQAEMAYDNTDAHHALWLAAEDIERGEHRRKEKP